MSSIVWAEFLIMIRQMWTNTNNIRGRRGCYRMVVGFTATYAFIVYNHTSCELEFLGEVYSIQHYVKHLSITYGKSVVVSGYSGILHK